MTVRFATLFAFVAAMLFGLATAATPSEAAEKAVTIKPSSGIVGTVVEAKLTGAPPNDPITVIFKIPGDPILTTGTTDANGEATFTFTIPYALSGTYPIFFTDFKCSCQIATDFTVIVGQRTPTPTATPTTPPTATPPATSTPTQPATATPTVTPQVPIAGTTTPFTPGGPNIGVLGLGFLLVLTVLAWFTATRRGFPGDPVAAGWPLDDGPDYSTDPDFSEMHFVAAESRPFRPIEEPKRLTRVVEAAAGTLDAIGLLFRKK